MPKSLTTEVAAELAKAAKSPIMLVSGAFDDGDLYLWTGLGTLDWNGISWLGAGDMIAISDLPDSSALEAQNMTLQLRGAVFENLALALDQVTQGSPVKVWLGFLDAAGVLIPDPFLAFTGAMDVPEIAEDGSSVDISITVEGRVARLLKKKERRRTHEDQQIDYPGDLGLEYVTGLQDMKVIWK